MNNVDTIVNNIRNIKSNDELTEVLEAIKLQRQFLARKVIRSVTVGDTVEFVAHGRTVQGTVDKVNRKNVKVREANSFTVWNVPASMLTVTKSKTTVA